VPKKKTKKHPLTAEDKKANRALASQRALNENIIGMLKRFKMIADTYRATGENGLASGCVDSRHLQL
jgi:hypothetical protein